MTLMFSFGTLALLSDARYRSFLPQLVSRPLLTQANARLQQSDTVAQTIGSAVAGAWWPWSPLPSRCFSARSPTSPRGSSAQPQACRA